MAENETDTTEISNSLKGLNNLNPVSNPTKKTTNKNKKITSKKTKKAPT